MLICYSYGTDNKTGLRLSVCLSVCLSVYQSVGTLTRWRRQLWGTRGTCPPRLL